ncbi:uncharacterized protein CXQ87_002533 [Candidozyma duobushaemuli]|uniref:GDS1 winged helix domain-containing protein n=2 Tax=Candidozyma TaxID=3303203 RepID=A0ABX8I4N5_9ASCO|nr:uncharacterized protein CXQ87_002533 [[Candida] duobushaemulonis]PVH14399.1 hypothetical protein CXQ87_002533 [[Candida] duobushaemulonis]QWU87428.1 hypothetical protein CA3LBN_001693 [[Candida] haemuloni]
MALADKRPLGVPVTSHASAYPMKSTIPDLKGVETAEQEVTRRGSVSPDGDLSPTSRSISPDSLMQQKKSSTSSFSSRDSTPQPSYYSANGGVFKKVKVPSRVPIATGISTTIPVTGEKPKPQQEGDASLEDDVLYAIFLILYEKDPAGAGMTVKQICDVLVERHPEMAQLSSKTSNLVSAKLNAYVKRVEKGDSNLRYALSREWADASPKRMVYVYRGLLAKNFHVNLPTPGTQPNSVVKPPVSDSLEAVKQSAMSKPRRSTMFDLGVSRPAFVESPIDRSNLFVPYASAPVAASLTEVKSEEPRKQQEQVVAKKSDALENAAKKDDDFDFDDLEVFDEADDDDDEIDFGDVLKKNGKRSKSMSYLSSNKKAKFLTAAAAAPRASKAPCSPSPNAAAAAAALHAAALKAIAAANSTSSSSASSLASSSGTSPASSVAPEATASPKTKDWQHAVRSGFLNQEIGAPEDISLSDLDKLFS